MITTTNTWERRRILIWGKTRPEISQKYREIVCTGGVFEDTKTLVRLYPIPLRYLEAEKVFAKYQWIEAEVQRAPGDRRPESYRISVDNIKVLDKIPANRTWTKRAPWVLASKNLFRSVEALQARQQADGTSLGIVRPKQVVQIRSTAVPPDERNTFWATYRRKVAQLQFEFKEQEPVKPLTPPDYRFQILFSCDDGACTRTHRFSVLDWEVDALYSKLRFANGDLPAVAAQKCVARLEELCGPSHETKFFLGNISTHPQNFTIVGFWYPFRSTPKAPTLLDGLDENSVAASGED